MSEYTDAVEAGLKDLKFPSTGMCPGCEECRGEFASDMSMAAFEAAWQRGEVEEYPNEFSTGRCGICDTSMAGARHVWHWVNEDNEIVHEDDACTDCVMFMCNGDEPEQWER